jgi:hypothetical protein
MRRKTNTKLTPEELFLNNFKTMTMSQLAAIYNRIGIEEAKVEVFKAFTLDLINTVYDTFLGNDTINNERDIIKHYLWCFDKVAIQYHSKWYKFNENEDLKEYFLEYFKENIYAVEESRELDLDHFSFLLQHNTPKQKFEVNSFIELYKLFAATPRKGRVLLR